MKACLCQRMITGFIFFRKKISQGDPLTALATAWGWQGEGAG